MKPPSYFSRSKPTCRMSDPSQPHKLCRRRSDPPLSICFACKGEHLEGSRYYYYCATCNLEFHRGCHLFPPEMKHPFHLSHPLTLVSLNPQVDSFKLPHLWMQRNSSDSEASIHDGDDDDDDKSQSNGSYKKCKCCLKRFKNVYYHCSICNFKLSYTCSTNPPPLTLTHLKSHQHTLTLFPRQLPLPCDACGVPLDQTDDHVYACLLCNYMVHGTCIYLPRVIKITRHPHRLSFTSSLPSGDFVCGVCRQTVDVNYGQYSCNKGCSYAVHSKCATREDVWDGKDLEGMPEESDEDRDIEPFVRIDEQTIQHFSHSHNLRLHKKGVLDDEKFCEACCLPIIISNDFYSCMQCDFVLDESCAYLPRKKHHPLHKHPLILYSFPPQPGELWHEAFSQGMFNCYACYRGNGGFLYKCGEKDCEFQLDVKCASLTDPLIHGSHPDDDHPLFFNLTQGECLGCQDCCSSHYLECMRCKSFLGVRCATKPSLAHYKHDGHPLTLSYGEKSRRDVQYWCEICESKVDAKTWFYTCDYCRVTLHVTCLLGKNMYMKPNHIIKIYGDDDEVEVEVEIVRNNGISRPVCDQCAHRCVDILVFKWGDIYYCTLSCMSRANDDRLYERLKTKKMGKAKEEQSNQ